MEMAVTALEAPAVTDELLERIKDRIYDTDGRTDTEIVGEKRGAGVSGTEWRIFVAALFGLVTFFGTRIVNELQSIEHTLRFIQRTLP
jgi:phosphosulfolactate phosphohydrolase-like enzyme